MKPRPITIEAINERVKNIEDEIKIEEVFEALNDIDRQMKEHPNPADKNFYQKKQDEINQMSDKLKEYYYDLLAILETYVACRSFELLIEYEANKKEKAITVNGKKVILSRAPGKETLRDACISEIPNLNYAVIVLKGWKYRADSALKTARNHTYSNDEKEDKDGEDDK